MQAEASNIVKKETVAQVFSCEFCEDILLWNDFGGFASVVAWLSF